MREMLVVVHCCANVSLGGKDARVVHCCANVSLVKDARGGALLRVGEASP